jgi:hypothetical protein
MLARSAIPGDHRSAGADGPVIEFRGLRGSKPQAATQRDAGPAWRCGGCGVRR